MGLINRISTQLSRRWLSHMPITVLQQRLSRRSGATGLCYHSISCDYPDYPYATTPDAFEEHLKFLSETFDIRPLRQVVDILTSEEPAGYGKSLAFISFDDAYRDNLYAATPILEKFDIPATLFAPRDLVRHDNTTHMSEEELKLIATHPLWDLGGHSLTHNPLAALTPEDMRHELAESQTWLEDLVCQPIDAFAYPLGSISDVVVEIAREYYSFAVSTDRSTCSTFDPLQIRRYCPTRHDNPAHALAQSLLLNPYEMA